MNILPQKRWHVRTKTNIDRVRRDERKAAEEEKALQDRIALAEQEARTELLRSKAGRFVAAKTEDSSGAILPSSRDDDTQQHVNLFEEVEQGLKKFGTNKEYESEKREEQEKQEKAIGLLTYLGQGSAETLTADEKPWYLKPDTSWKESGSVKNDSAPLESDSKGKQRLDPMRKMMKYIEMTKKFEDSKEEKNKSKKRHKLKHKHKHKMKHKEKDRSRKDGHELTSSKVSINQLRAERLERERAERQRSELLLAKHRGELKSTDTKSEEVELNDRKRKYHSQFNPEFARQPKNRA